MMTIWFSDRVLKWVPPVAVVVIFILQFWPWVGVYPGGVPAVTQNAWQAGFAGATTDPDMASIYPGTREKDRKKSSEGRSESGEKDTKKSSESRSERTSREEVVEPNASWLTLLYLLPFFLVTLIVTLAVAVLPFLSVQLPPQVQQILPWRWAIVTGLNAVLLLFLGLQMVLSFDLESKADAWIKRQPIAQQDPADLKTPQKKERQAFIGERQQWIERTGILYLALLLHILATASAAIVYGVEKRGPTRPLPRLELMW
jgi:hypothetical protein